MKKKITQSSVSDWSKLPPNKAFDVYDTVCKGFVARVRPSGTVTFLLKYDTLTGTSRNFTIGRNGIDGMDATKARDTAEDIKHAIKKGADPQRERRQARENARTDLDRTLGNYLENCHKPHHLKNRTNRGRNESLRILNANFGHLYDRPLHDIGVDDIERWQNGMEDKGRDSETIKRNRAEIESLYSHAQREQSPRWKWIKQNPIASVTPIKEKPPEQLKPRYLSAEENIQLITAFRERDVETRE